MPMAFEEFEASLSNIHPPAGLSPCLTALWHDKKGDWNQAHEIVQEIDTSTAAWVHAYLHRKEGDEWNAGYWYRQAGKSFPFEQPLDDEWGKIAQQLLKEENRQG